MKLECAREKRRREGFERRIAMGNKNLITAAGNIMMQEAALNNETANFNNLNNDLHEMADAKGTADAKRQTNQSS